MAAYYNEIDAYAADWLERLIAAGHLPAGDVDRRDIREVRGDDLRGYDQCHFFAGIGGWPYALRLADWPDDQPVWTGSCPCQPLSSAGQRKGHADERHLWPAFYDLVAERRPATVLGEQVASKDGREWLAGVRADLEHLGYACGAADLPAAGAGAPHIRARLFWLADAGDAERRAVDGHGQDGRDGAEQGRPQAHGEPGACGEIRGLADASAGRCGAGQRHLFAPRRQPDPCRGREAGGLGHPSSDDERQHRPPEAIRESQKPVGGSGSSGGLANTPSPQLRQVAPARDEPGNGENGGFGVGLADRSGAGLAGRPEQPARQECAAVERGGSHGGFWSAARWLPCADGKARRIEPGVFPLAARLPLGLGRLRARRKRVAALAGLDAGSLRAAKRFRIGALKGYGNAIVPQAAAAFVAAFLEAREP